MSPIRSMTGFGRAQRSSDLGSFAIEVRSVNHRFFDSRVHLPRELSALEIPLLRIARRRVSRGKVEISVRFTPGEENVPRVRFSKVLLECYRAELAEIAASLGEESPVSLEYLLSLPGVSEKKDHDLDETRLLELARETLEEALEGLIEQREREGRALEDEIAERLDRLEEMRAQIEARCPEVVDAYRTRLRKKAREWAETGSMSLDEGRLEAEALLFAERSDVSEELVRLAAHIGAFRSALEGPQDKPQGKAMEFLTQELLRETNTIASKARDTQVASLVLVMKNEVERIREQVMNVE